MYIGSWNRGDYDIDSLKKERSIAEAHYEGLRVLVDKLEAYDNEKHFKEKINSMKLFVGDTIIHRYTGNDHRQAIITKINSDNIWIRQRLKGNKGWYKDDIVTQPDYIHKETFDTEDLPEDVNIEIKDSWSKNNETNG